MKKVFLSIAPSTIIFAQDSIPKISPSPELSVDDNGDNLINISAIESLIPLFAIALVVILIIQVTKSILDHKLKNKIIDRTISEQLANSILQKGVDDKKDDSIKWSILLLFLSGGLIVAYHTLPLDIHSIAIIAFSAGLSYLAYFFYLQKKNK